MTSVSSPGQTLGQGAAAPVLRPGMATVAEPPMSGIGSLLLRNRIPMLRGAILGVVAAVLLTLFMPREYTSTFSFTPQEAAPKGGLSAIAMDLGMNLGGNASQSPDFYVGLLHTRLVLGRLLDEKFVVKEDGVQKELPLIDIIRPASGEGEARRRVRALAKLNEKIKAGFSIKTNVVTVSTTSSSPELALQLARRVIEEINRFNRETRRSQSSAERTFTEQRLAEAKRQLQEAEQRRIEFSDQNRLLGSSAALAVRREAIDRETTLMSVLYNDLSRALFQARLEEVRNTPLITVIDQPEAPAVPDSRRGLVKVLFGAIIGAALFFFIAVVRESLTRTERTAAEGQDEFVVLWHETMRDLRHPGRLLRALVMPQRHRRQPG